MMFRVNGFRVCDHDSDAILCNDCKDLLNGKRTIGVRVKRHATSADVPPPPPDLNAAIRAARREEDYKIAAPSVRLAANGVPEPADMNAAIRAASRIEDFTARVRTFLSGGR